jgi:hypothetical protein
MDPLFVLKVLVLKTRLTELRYDGHTGLKLPSWMANTML